MDKIKKSDEKIKNQKIENEKKLHIKYNKLNMTREDRKNKVLRSERIKDYERSKKMDMINERMKRIDEMQKDRYLLEEERRKMEEELNNQKSVMLHRLEDVIKSDKNMTKDEIMEYVLNDVKPGNKNKEEKNINNNGNNDPVASKERQKE